MEKLLTASEVAERLGIHTWTVYTLAHKRTIPAMKIGTQFRFNFAKVLKAMEKWKR